jgi:glycosyltransferase involved in cell wall biosynthesis
MGMRVLHVHDRAGFQGGVEQILHDTAAGLSALGHPQGLLSADESVCPDFIRPFESIATGLAHAELFRPDVLILHKWQDARLVSGLLDRYPGVQVVHDHDLYCPRRHKYFPLSHRQCGLRAGTACATHLCLVHRKRNGWPLGWTSLAEFRQRQAVAARAALFVAGSTYSRDQLALNGIEHARIRVVSPVPATVGRLDPLPPGEPGRMLFMGQVVRGKGVDLLLEAAAGLQGRWRLDIVGDGPQLEACRAQARRLCIEDRVEITGWVGNAALRRWVERCAFLVVPSRWPEPFGMVGIEAMSRARAVVGFRSGGIPDWLEDETTGLLVGPGCSASLRQAMQSLIDEPGRAERMGQQALESVRRRFSHSGFLEAMEAAARDSIAIRHASHSHIASQNASIGASSTLSALKSSPI